MKSALLAGALVLGWAGAEAAPVADLPPGGVIELSWVINPAADQYIGIAVCRVTPKRLGWYVEVKTGRGYSAGDDYYESISVGEAEGWGDRLLDTAEVHTSGALGLTAALSRALALYAGVGFDYTSHYRQYYDTFHILGSDGEYWIDDEGGGTEAGLVGGALLRVSQAVLVQAGYGSAPAGLNIGVGFTMDWPF